VACPHCAAEVGRPHFEAGRMMLARTPRKETTLRRLLAACRRLDRDEIDDVLGVIFVFALPVLVLALGALIDGGM